MQFARRRGNYHNIRLLRRALVAAVYSLNSKQTIMAKKKRNKRKSSSRRRKVGALALNASSPLVKYGSIVAGYFVGDKINTNVIDKITGGKIDNKTLGIAQTVGGGFLALKKKKAGMTGTLLTVAGGLIAGAGIKRAMSAFGVGRVGGYKSVPVLGNTMNGYGAVPVIGGRRRVGGYTTNAVPPGSALGGGYTVGPSVSRVMGSAVTDR